MARISRTTARSIAATTVASSLLTIDTKRAGFTDITREVAAFLREISAGEGAVSLFIRHT